MGWDEMVELILERDLVERRECDDANARNGWNLLVEVIICVWGTDSLMYAFLHGWSLFGVCVK